MSGPGIVGALAGVPRAVALGDFWSKLVVPAVSVVAAPFTGGASLALNAKKVQKKMLTKGVANIAIPVAATIGAIALTVATAGVAAPTIGVAFGAIGAGIEKNKAQHAQSAANNQFYAAQGVQAQAAKDFAALPWYEQWWQTYPTEIAGGAGLLALAILVRKMRG